MKNLLIIISMLTLATTQATAQNSDWNMRLGGGYFVGGKVEAKQGLMDVTNGGSFETGLQYRIGYQRYVGVRYMFAGTGLLFEPYNEYNFYNPQEITMNAHFIGIATTQYFTDNTAKPYFETTFSANIYAPADMNSQTYFSLGFGGGVMVELSDLVGLRVGGEMQLPFGGDASGVYCGIGYYSGPNCGLSVNGGVIATQLNFGAAFTFAL